MAEKRINSLLRAIGEKLADEIYADNMPLLAGNTHISPDDLEGFLAEASDLANHQAHILYPSYCPNPDTTPYKDQ